jgi:hypothetical protein
MTLDILTMVRVEAGDKLRALRILAGGGRCGHLTKHRCGDTVTLPQRGVNVSRTCTEPMLNLLLFLLRILRGSV